MPISGLVLTLSEKPVLQEQALARLRTRDELQLGKLVDRWLPIAVTALDDEQCRELHDWMLATPGVEQVDVVYVNFEAAAFEDEAKAMAESDRSEGTLLQSKESESMA